MKRSRASGIGSEFLQGGWRSVAAGRRRALSGGMRAMLAALLLLAAGAGELRAQECPEGEEEVFQRSEDLDLAFDEARYVFVARLTAGDAAEMAPDAEPRVTYHMVPPALKGDIPETGELALADCAPPVAEDDLVLVFTADLAAKLDGRHLLRLYSGEWDMVWSEMGFEWLEARVDEEQ